MLRQVKCSVFAFVAGAGLLAPVVLAGQAAASKPAADTSKLNQLTPEEQKSGWILLFNGRNLDGWRGYKKTDASDTRWKVENGMLTLPPNDGKDTLGARDIISNDTFEQFELSWDWRIAQGGNSGVKYFVLEDRDAAIGHEYQLIDDERHPDAKVGPKRQTAAFYDVLAASDRPLKPAGEFNTSRVIVRGNTVEHWLNGKKVLTYQLDSPALRAAIEQSKFKGIDRFGKLQNGHILLQDHGNQVWFRNIKIKKGQGSTKP
jgi:Domain of Unknown Function (DUF1080)